MSVQFHPEANAGPEDTVFLFDVFVDFVRKSKDSKSSCAWRVFIKKEEQIASNNYIT